MDHLRNVEFNELKRLKLPMPCILEFLTFSNKGNWKKYILNLEFISSLLITYLNELYQTK